MGSGMESGMLSSMGSMPESSMGASMGSMPESSMGASMEVVKHMISARGEAWYSARVNSPHVLFFGTVWDRVYMPVWNTVHDSLRDQIWGQVLKQARKG